MKEFQRYPAVHKYVKKKLQLCKEIKQITVVFIMCHQQPNSMYL